MPTHRQKEPIGRLDVVQNDVEDPLAAIVSGRCYYDPKATFAASKGARMAPIYS